VFEEYAFTVLSTREQYSIVKSVHAMTLLVCLVDSWLGEKLDFF